jgi:hypothetical protein
MPGVGGVTRQLLEHTTVPFSHWAVVACPWVGRDGPTCCALAAVHPDFP